MGRRQRRQRRQAGGSGRRSGGGGQRRQPGGSGEARQTPQPTQGESGPDVGWLDDLEEQVRSRSSETPGQSPSAPDGIMLEPGDRGRQVQRLQRALRKNGFQVELTGEYDAATEAAVREYQTSRGLSVDGIAGPDTVSALMSGAPASGADHGTSGGSPAGPTAGADTEVQPVTDRDPYVLYGTGRYDGTNTTTREMPDDWTAADMPDHHADRTSSWAADNLRGGGRSGFPMVEGASIPHDQVEAYDFTFAEPGTNLQRGLPLHAPTDCRVLDFQAAYGGGVGGYGKFILLEYLDTGGRVEVHHLDALGPDAEMDGQNDQEEPFTVGQVIPGGTVIGTQGGSGDSRSQYAVHIDIVGVAGDVERFVRANAEGTFDETIRAPEGGAQQAAAQGGGETEGEAERPAAASGGAAYDVGLQDGLAQGESGVETIRNDPTTLRALSNAARQSGIDLEDLIAMAIIESGGDRNIGTNSFGYTGLMQIGSAAASDMGVTMDSVTGGDNVENNAMAGANYWLLNDERLDLDIPRDPLHMYLAHQQGAGGTNSLMGDLATNPDQALNRNQTNNLPGSVTDALGRLPTVQDFYDYWAGKMAGLEQVIARTAARS